MTPSLSQSAAIGFLTILGEPTGYVGGYLVTNLWGRPLEFRISSAVQPSRVQRILYGDSLEPYLCGELIGKTLVEKTATRAHAIFTDTPAALELRGHIELPVVLVQQDAGEEPFVYHPRFPGDQSALGFLRERLGSLDLAEPFARIREALGEARRMGVAGRAMAA